MARPLTVKTNEEAEAAGWAVVIVDKDVNPLGWELVQKASFEDPTERVLHTTKKRKVVGGWIYESYTEILIKSDTLDSEIPIQVVPPTIACSKAGWFVPEAVSARDKRLSEVLEEALEKLGQQDSNLDRDACEIIRGVADSLAGTRF